MNSAAFPITTCSTQFPNGNRTSIDFTKSVRFRLDSDMLDPKKYKLPDRDVAKTRPVASTATPKL